MSASAAAAAGYTLAAGPVRADAIKTDTNGLTAGDAKVKVDGGDMPVYFAQAGQRAEPAGHPGLRWRSSACTNTSRTSPAGSPSSARFAIAPDYYFRKGDLTKITEHAEPVADRQRQDRRRAVRRSRRHGGVGEVAGRRHQPARHHGLLPRRPHRVALLDPQSEPQGRRRVLRQPRSTRATPCRRARSNSRPR